MAIYVYCIAIVLLAHDPTPTHVNTSSFTKLRHLKILIRDIHVNPLKIFLSPVQIVLYLFIYIFYIWCQCVYIWDYT